MGWQVHGTELQEWDGPPRPASDPRLERRSTGTSPREPGLGLLVLVADCLPVALAGGDQVAMVHCGWRRPGRRHPGEGGGALRRGCPLRPSGPASGRAATRWARRCSRLRGPRRRGAGAHARPAPRGTRKLEAAGVDRDRERGPVHELPRRTCSSRTGATTASPAGRAASCGGPDAPCACARTWSGCAARIERAGGDPAEIEICAATKYLPAEDLPALAEAGIGSWGRTARRTCSPKQARTATCSSGTSSARCRAAR